MQENNIRCEYSADALIELLTYFISTYIIVIAHFIS